MWFTSKKGDDIAHLNVPFIKSPSLKRKVQLACVTKSTELLTIVGKANRSRNPLFRGRRHRDQRQRGGGRSLNMRNELTACGQTVQLTLSLENA
ncbi:hypothetical protein GDO86_001481 [Hymenochirus boettgeri]|uniref:Uncharacterized protein n=1 Tax=Hymenochirus boettgeri TaxID=247094 RepID=A0A8T2KDU4_9PIPI|nr:hypothetical protein GDO86_001481 [Hymenochirus boettgeri]